MFFASSANGALEKLASQGLSPSMILYLTKVYGMKSAHASNVIFLWSAASNFTPIICAFLADSYFGRFPMIAAGSIFSFLVISYCLLFQYDYPNLTMISLFSAMWRRFCICTEERVDMTVLSYDYFFHEITSSSDSDLGIVHIL